MALAIHQDLENQPLPALSLVMGKKSNEGISRAGVEAAIYQLMLLVGENMSKIQQVYAQNQMNEGVIAQNQAKNTQDQTKVYLDKLKKQEAQQREAAKWAEAFKWLKWIGLAVGVLVAAMTAGTASEFLLMAVPMAVMSSPVGSMAISALGSAIAKSLGNTEEGKTWGNILAQAITLVVVTVVTFGTETAMAASNTATKVVEDVATEVEGAVAKEVAEEAAAQGSSFTATKMNFMQTLASTNLLGSLVTQLVELIPGDKEKKKEAEMWLGLIANLAVMACSLKFAYNTASEGANLFSKVGEAFECEKQMLNVERGITAMVGAVNATESTINGGVGYYNIDLSYSQSALAPLRSEIEFGKGFFQVLLQISNLAQKTYQSLMEGNRVLFETNFAADWQACAYQG